MREAIREGEQGVQPEKISELEASTLEAKTELEQWKELRKAEGKKIPNLKRQILILF